MMLNNLDHAGGGNWIAGYWLKKRWGVAEFEIVDAMREGHLHPRNSMGKFLTEEQCPDESAMAFYLECGINGQIVELKFVDLALFSMSEVQAFEAIRGLGIPDRAQEQRFTGTPGTYVQKCRERGVHDAFELARLVDKEFTGPRILSDLAMGRLLPADTERDITDASARDRGKRLRGKKK